LTSPGRRRPEFLRQPDLGDDEEALIYVIQPWSPEAAAILVSPAPRDTSPIEENGKPFAYFLEAFIAREFVDDLVDSGDPTWESERRRCERLIGFAQNDA
jgi:hypothetical protein